MNNKSGISGHIRVFITDEHGVKRLTFDDHNAIQGDYADIIVDALQAATDYGFNNMFTANANPPGEDEDGIAIKENGGLWYSMIMAATVVSSGVIKFTGTFTGVAVTIANAADVMLGHKWENAAVDFTSVGDAYGKFAVPAGWVSQAVGIAETLTIEWTITHY